MQQAAAIHQDVACYISKVIELKPHPEQANKSYSGILGPARKVGNERLRSACRRAAYYSVYNYPIIVEILAKQLDTLEETEHLGESRKTRIIN